MYVYMYICIYIILYIYIRYEDNGLKYTYIDCGHALASVSLAVAGINILF